MHDHTIPVHRGLSGIPGDVDIAANPFERTVRDEEPVAVAMHVEPAGGVFAAEPRRYERARPKFDQFAAFGQAIERGLQLFARLPVRPELPNELFKGRARVGELRDVVE